MTPTEQQAFDALTAANKWIEKAKPLLARGGDAERDNVTLRDRLAESQKQADSLKSQAEAAGALAEAVEPVAAQATKLLESKIWPFESGMTFEKMEESSASTAKYGIMLSLAQLKSLRTALAQFRATR